MDKCGSISGSWVRSCLLLAITMAIAFLIENGPFQIPHGPLSIWLVTDFSLSGANITRYGESVSHRADITESGVERNLGR